MNDRPLALVFTMGKVGSSTVMNALNSIGRNPDRGYAGNIHQLAPFDRYEKVITVVRDPAARNASLYFERGGRGMTEFVKLFDHLEPLNWLTAWGIELFGIDIMSKPFPRRKGWQIYEDWLLLIRTEDLSEKLPEAFAELFGVDPLEVDSEHRAETVMTRKYGDEYQEFINNLKLPADILDEIYNSDFMNHFYYKKEIAEFRKRWS